MLPLRVIFMGTPEFAVATLGALTMNGFNVIAVVTVPDKPAGRGQKITCSAVKEYAVENKIPVLQPEKLKDPGFIEKLKAYNADVFVVVAFRMLPEVIWKMPKSGTINLHASLLPHYRGAAPINHVIINGETKTGVTTFLINENIDTGNILLREEVEILPEENAGDLHDRLMRTGARLVIQTLKGISEKSIIPNPQSVYIKPGEIIHEAPKIYPDDCFINWDKDAHDIQNMIRGLSPYPGARTKIANSSQSLILKLFESNVINEKHKLTPGSIITDDKSFLRIACRKGLIEISLLQLEGKKKMTTCEFLRGFKISSFLITSI